MFDYLSRYLNFDLTGGQNYGRFNVVGCITDAVRFQNHSPSNKEIDRIRNYCWAHGIYPENYYQTTFKGKQIYLRKELKNTIENTIENVMENTNQTKSFQYYLVFASWEREEISMYKKNLCVSLFLLLAQAIYLALLRCTWRSSTRLMREFSISVNLIFPAATIFSMKLLVFGKLHPQLDDLLGFPDLSIESQHLANDSDLFRQLIARRPVENYVKLEEDLRSNVAVWKSIWPLIFASQFLFVLFSAALILIPPAFDRSKASIDESSDERSSIDSKSRFIKNPGYEFDRPIDDAVESDEQKNSVPAVNV